MADAKKTALVLHAFIAAAGVFLYTAAIAWFLSNAEAIFGRIDTFWIPAIMLSLFVLSAAVTGSLVLGRPVHLYWNGAQKEAIVLFVYTIAFLFLIIASALGVLLAAS